ncbi:MAG: hydrogenase maturation nickel metallochaperone HypA/HybF [Thermogutta sp.]
MALVEALLESVHDHLRDSGIEGRVRRVEVVIGPLSGVVPEAFRFAFEVLSPETLGPACELFIRTQPASCRCEACGVVSEIVELTYSCPHCGSSAIQLEGGRGLLLQSIEVEEHDSEKDHSSTDSGQG